MGFNNFTKIAGKTEFTINNDVFIKMKSQAEELDNLVLEETNFIDELIELIDIEKFVVFAWSCLFVDYREAYKKHI